MEIWLNGEIVNNTHCPDILEPGFMFGWGVFETLRVYAKKPAFLDEHIARLKEGAEKIFLDFPSLDFAEVIEKLLKANKLSDAYCRLSLFKKRKSTGTLVYIAPFNYYPPQDYQEGFRAIISPAPKFSRGLLSGVKPLSYLESRLAWKIAQDKGKQEALFLTEEGFLAEGSRTNIFFSDGSYLYTPSLECGILAGITRQKVISLAQELGIKVKEGKFRLNDLLAAKEAFLTSSLMEVMPLVEVEEKIIGAKTPGQISLKLLSAYRSLAKSS